METKKLNTIKEVFSYIHDTERFLEEEEFICYAIAELACKRLINSELHHKTLYFLHKNKPKDDDFTSHPQWSGSYSWWVINYNIKTDKSLSINELKAIYLEKRRFLYHLIKKL